MVDGGGARLLPVILDSRRYFQFVSDCNFRWKLKSGVMVIFTCSQTTEVPVIEGLDQAKLARQGLQEGDSNYSRKLGMWSRSYTDAWFIIVRSITPWITVSQIYHQLRHLSSAVDERATTLIYASSLTCSVNSPCICHILCMPVSTLLAGTGKRTNRILGNCSMTQDRQAVSRFRILDCI